ncbi:hypothetical protein PV325_012155 [Microctonus aethiopoides]|nr:hypothetical protein PV325_012155 [Microctonus aethiopoides]KAK0073700.1 hypothetical protein PV326_013152 [Microctonus aethiopoides]
MSKEYPYLAASPEGIMEDGTIIIIKCPYAARNVTPAEAIERKITSVHTWFNKNVTEKNAYFYRLDRSMPVSGLNEQMVISGINESERADSIVSLPDISRVCIKTNSLSSSDRVHRTINHRYDTDGIIMREEMLISDHMDMFQEICEDLTDGLYKQ